MYIFSFQIVPTDANNILVLKINHGLNFPAVDFILEEMERLSEKGKNCTCKL